MVQLRLFYRDMSGMEISSKRTFGLFFVIVIKCSNCQEFVTDAPKPSEIDGATTDFVSGAENSSSLDPCSNSFEYTILTDDGYRSAACPSSISNHLCDSRLEEAWYRLQSSDESLYLRIPQACPSIRSCGTDNPIWMNGSYPSVEEGIVRKQMCIRTAYGCCQDSFDVRVKNCSSFFTFKLKPVPKCNQRYCFEGGVCGLPSMNTPTPDVTVPHHPLCPNGTYRQPNNSSDDSNRRNPCLSCPSGFFCVRGKKNRCPPGFYCSPGSSDPISCPSGNYCPPGQTYPVQCSAGYYNPSNTSINSSDCQSCPPGYYCFLPGIDKPTGPCLPGFYCSGGSTTGTPVDGVMGGMCTVGNYCPRGSAKPIPCPQGYFNPETTRESCEVCPQNLTCPEGSVYPFECNPESENISAQCSLSPAQPTTNPCFNRDGSQQVGICAECPVGHLCRDGFNITCPEGYYCPDGSSVFICPAGSYCPEGQVHPLPCETGTFNPYTGNGTKEACLQCSPGLYCGEENLAVPTGPCSSGFYCTGGATTPTPLNGRGGDICRAGYFCLEGTGILTPCPNSTYNPSRGQSNIESCLKCPDGLTCNGTGLSFPNECHSNVSHETDCSGSGGDYCSNDGMCLNDGKCIIYNRSRGFCECVPHFEGNFCETDTTLLFLVENSTLTYLTVEREETIMEIVFGTSFIQSEMEITWYRGNLMIRNSSRVMLTIEMMEDSFRLYKAKLRLKSAKSYDNGTLTVVASIQRLGIAVTVNMSLTVLELPSARVSPLSLSVQTGGTIELKCLVENSAQRNTTVKLEWVKNRDIISRQKNFLGNESVLRIPNAQKYRTGKYFCSLTYSLLGVSGRTAAASDVFVYSPDDIRCKKTVDELRIEWGDGITGTTYYALCPNQYVGNASKLCKTDGSWDRTVTINCVEKILSEANEELDNIITDNVIDTDFVSSVVDRQMSALTNWTAKNIGTSGDIDKTVGLLDKILKVTNAADAKLPDQDFTKVVDSVLNERQSQNWKDINEQTKDGSSRILSTVSEFGHQISQGLKDRDNKTFEENNYLMIVGRGSRNEAVKFPSGAATDSSSLVLPVQSEQNTEDIDYSATVYHTMYSFLPSRNELSKNTTNNFYVNSDVLSMDIMDKRERTSLNPGIMMNIKHKGETNLQKTEVVCVFWNFTLRSWSSEGCNTTKVNNHVTKCECDHLTNFAILMRPYAEEKEDDVLTLISLIGCSITVVLSTVTFFIFIILWRYVKNDQNLVLVHLCLSISLGYLLFLLGVSRTENKILCTVIAAFLQYFFLVEFFLMLAMGVYYFLQITVLYYSFSTANDIKARLNMKRILPIAWIIPILITGITVGSTYTREYNQSHVCWLSTESGSLYGFVGPVLLIICINIFIICSLFRVMCATRLLSESNTKKKATTGLRSLCTLLPVLGITWVFGILSINDDLIAFQYLFAVFNSLQGLFIFLPNCVFNKKVREGLLHKMRLFESQQENSKIQSKNSKRFSNAHENLKKNEKDRDSSIKKGVVQPVRLIRYTKQLDFIDGGYDNMCFDDMLPLDVIPFRSQSLSQNTLKTSETYVQSNSDENGFDNVNLNDQNHL
ncbi:adhesion G-protein coupled receptor F3-like isoform X7 [Ostrea edulis]|uniref:adhesion G-protein coupled receptor F3-like isoform X7 n=2 Tax=Ostrea edulis TaxID=37623 RepID=UPI0024AFD9C4|nr:adhesion G-protein coupled receptor F3-like isoform X7 [Ostrea edulis]